MMATPYDPVYGFNVVEPDPEEIAQLRRMAGEPQDDSTYTDESLFRYVMKYPIIDGFGYEPDDPQWTPGFDLAAAAADVWAEKASCLATSQYDFSADGATYSRHQRYEDAINQARYWQSKRVIRPIRMVVDHKFERDTQAEPESVVSEYLNFAINLPEVDDDDVPEAF